jgi:hypothetical protein
MPYMSKFDELVRKLKDGKVTMADYAVLAELEDILEAEAIAGLEY